MRSPSFLALAAVLPLLAPAAAAEIAFEGPTRRDAPLLAGEAHAFLVPFTTSGGAVYAKLLPTPENVVHDGERANGTLDPPAGWRVAFAIREADGTRNDLGARVDSEPTPTVQLAAGERATLEVTIHAPADAVAPARVHAVLALASEPGAAGGSGARQDEARALTFVLTEESARAPDPGRGTPFPAGVGLLVIVALPALSRGRRRAE